MNKYTQNIGKKFLALFAGLFIFANIFPLCTALIGESENFTPTTYAATADSTNNTGSESSSETANQNNESVIDQINSAEGSKIKKQITEFATLIVSLFTPIIAMVVKFAGVLMGDAFILGRNGEADAFPVAALLYELWDVVRTLVNYAFLLILLFVAVMNIFPISKDKYQLQSILPSLVIGIVTVNMTWFMTRVIFDAVDVATHVVYALPESIANKHAGDKKLFQMQPCVINQISPSDWDNENHKPKAGVTEPNAETGKEKPYTHGSCYPAYTTIQLDRGYSDISIQGKNNASAHALDIDIDEGDEKALEKLGDTVLTKVNYGALTIYWKDFDYSNFNEGTILPLMAFSMMQVQNLPRIASKAIKDTTGANGEFVLPDNWTTLFINTLLALILMVIILILFIVMVVNLFGRIIILWVNIIASPVIALNFVAEKAGFAGLSGDGKYLGANVFITQAFAPAIMGLPFVIGFILISVGQQYSIPGLETIGDTTVKGGALVDGLASTHALFYHFLTIAVLWAGGVKAMEITRNDITGGFADGIISTVKSAGAFIAKAPMKIPIIPVGTDANGNMQLASGNNFKNDFGGKWIQKFEKLDDKVRDQWRGSINSKFTKDHVFDNAKIEQNSSEGKQAIKALKEIPLDMNTFKNIKTGNQTEQEAVQEYLRKSDKINDRLVNQITSYRKLAEVIYELKHPNKHAQTADAIATINPIVTAAQAKHNNTANTSTTTTNTNNTANTSTTTNNTNNTTNTSTTTANTNNANNTNTNTTATTQPTVQAPIKNPPASTPTTTNP